MKKSRQLATNDILMGKNEPRKKYIVLNSGVRVAVPYSHAILTIYITVFVTRGRHFGARESVISKTDSRASK
jgi:hypothetical protein